MARFLSCCIVASVALVVLPGASAAAAADPAVADSAASCAAGDQCADPSGMPSSANSSKGGDHLLLQLGGRRLLHASTEKGPGDVGSSGCIGMPDVLHKCSHNGCKVLAGDMVGLSCDDYCHRSGRRCESAWEEVNNDCSVKHSLRCDESYGTTSDLLCQCSPGLVGGSLKGAELIWSDDFDGQHIDHAKWHFVNGGGGFGNNELQHYTDRHDNAHVRDGVLRITAKCEDLGHEHFTSAKMTTKHRASWGPGHRVEVRARSPTAKGTWPAIWMLPTEDAYGDWPASGEIDIMESVGCSRNKIYGTVHTGVYNHIHNTQAYGSRHVHVSEWHTYAIQWEEHKIQWFVDGELFGSFAPTHRNSERWPFGKDFYLILNLAVGGAWGGMCLHGHRPSCSHGSEFRQGQVLEVDYARVYRL